MIENILQGFVVCFQPSCILFLLTGVVMGVLVGAIPGINDTLLISLLGPVVMYLPLETGFLWLAAIYCAAIYGGSITAILFRTPGTPAAACTVFDGYELTKKRQAGKALNVAILSSAIGGILSVIVLMTFSPILAKAALQFGPPEYFSLAILGLSVASSLVVKSAIKGTLSMLIGLFIATIGMDPRIGVPRFTFGSNFLLSGVQFIPVIIGIFAIGEIFYQTDKIKEEKSIGKTAEISQLLSLKEFKGILPTIIKSSGIGTIVGALPGAGATIAAFLSYGVAVRSSKHPEKFGTGILEGVAAPEAANNASTGGAMIPLISLGIPGGSTTAILLTMLLMRGLHPGPRIFLEQPHFVYTLFAGMFIANLFMLPFGISFIKLFVKILKVSKKMVYPVIFFIGTIGTYALRSNFMDIWVMFTMGIIGYLMRKYEYPESPLILGLILGSIAEINLRTSLLMFKSPSIFFARPISGVLLIVGISLYLFPLVRNYLIYKKSSNIMS